MRGHLFHTGSASNRYYAWFQALHTRVDLLLLGPFREDEFAAIEDAVLQELLAVEQMGNRFNPESELSQAVQAATTRSFPLSPELYTLLERCLRANRETGGLFDITTSSPAFEPGLIRAVELLPSPTGDGGSLRLHRPGIILDLSGVLKGYALERLRHLLTARGIDDALINLGGSSILSLGSNPSDIPPGHCFTTSGNDTPERRHIRHPLTGQFIGGLRTASVTTRNGIDGEILSIVRFLE